MIAGVDGIRSEQAKLTFAMARHAVVDIAQVVNARYDPDFPDRLPAQEMARLRQSLSERGLRLKEGAEFEEKLAHLRSLYEPYALSMRAQFVHHPAAVDSCREEERQLAGRPLGSRDSGQEPGRPRAKS